MKDLFQIPAEELRRLGIVDWGYTEELVPASFERFRSWLGENRGVLPFLELEKNVSYRSRLDAYFPQAKSALVFLFGYAPAKRALLDAAQTRIAAYALGFDGEDYHAVMKRRLRQILERLQEHHPTPIDYRISHDTEAVLERDLAYRAGLGWFGKNSMLIARQHGSYFMLGSLLLDRRLALPERERVADHCGTCRACVDACPTRAIDPETRTLVLKDCISAWTIEVRDEAAAAPPGTENARGELFGCDICQDVCPWNTKPLADATPQLGPTAQTWASFFHRDLREVVSDILPLTNRAFLRFVEDTALGRPGRKAWLRTLSFWLKRGR